MGLSSRAFSLQCWLLALLAWQHMGSFPGPETKPGTWQAAVRRPGYEVRTPLPFIFGLAELIPLDALPVCHL